MVKLQKLTEAQKEALKKSAQYRIQGPCSTPSIDIKQVNEVLKGLRVEVDAGALGSRKGSWIR
jgi:hypothetical protein